MKPFTAWVRGGLGGLGVADGISQLESPTCAVNRHIKTRKE